MYFECTCNVHLSNKNMYIVLYMMYLIMYITKYIVLYTKRTI